MATPAIHKFILLIKLLSAVVLLADLSSCLKREADAVHIRDGLLDLREHDLETAGPLSIKGPWEFYHRKFIHPADPDFYETIKSPVYLNVPGNWIGKIPFKRDGSPSDSPPIPRHTYGSYRLTILLPPESRGKNIGLRIFEAGTAYRLYVNGELKMQAGTPGTDKESSVPVKQRKYAYFISDGNAAELIIHISNFHHRSGGLWYGAEIGTPLQIRILRNNALFYEFTLFGAILVIGVYHLGLFMFRKNDYEALTFSMFCFAVTLRILTHNESYILESFPSLSFDLKMKLEYMSSFAATGLFTAFSQILFPNKKIRQYITPWHIVNTALIVFVLLTPPEIFTMTLSFYPVMAVSAVIFSILLVSSAMQQQIQGAPVALFGMIVLGLTYLNDIFHGLGIIQTYYMVQEGILIFIVSQSFIMAQKFADAFFIAKTLSENLESVVRERTLSLKAAIESKQHLLHVISHDLRNTLGNIQNAADTLISENSLAETEKQSLLRIILNNTDLSLHMIDEINRIDAIKSGKISLRQVPIRLKECLEKSIALNSDQVRHKRIAVELRDIPDISVCSDPDFLTVTVFANIINNAVKFSFPDTKIIITAQKLPESSKAVICIKDFGTGIPEKAIAKIFDPSERTTSIGTLGERGTGFGLLLAYQFIEASGGSITIESVVRKNKAADMIQSDVFGTKVCVTLPLCSENNTGS